MANSFYRDCTVNFFFLTLILANICFYFTLKRTSPSKASLNFFAILFNAFFVLMLISIIKLLRKTPQYLNMSEDKLASHLEAFSEAQIERKGTKNTLYGTDQEFQLYLQNYGLRYCERCFVIKAG